MGATAFQKGLGAIHSLSHPIGALFDTHHGRTNAVVMPYVIAFNRDAITERYRDLSRYLDLGNSGIDSVMEWVLELRRTVGIEHTLAEIGVDDHLTDEVVRQASTIPRPPPIPACSTRTTSSVSSSTLSKAVWTDRSPEVQGRSQGPKRHTTTTMSSRHCGCMRAFLSRPMTTE